MILLAWIAVGLTIALVILSIEEQPPGACIILLVAILMGPLMLFPLAARLLFKKPIVKSAIRRKSR